MTKSKVIFISVFFGIVFLVSVIMQTIFFIVQKDESSPNSFINTDDSNYALVNNGVDLWTGTKINTSTYYEFIKTLGNSNTTTYSSLYNAIDNTMIVKNAQDLRAYTYGKSNTQSIGIKIGGLTWFVTALSRDTEGNLIATLWLTSEYQDWTDTTGDGNNCVYYAGTDTVGANGLYSKFALFTSTASSTSKYPANMYGTSYMRAVTLNNGGAYATSLTATTTATKNANNHFYVFTNGSTILSAECIQVPDKIAWQHGDVQNNNVYLDGFNTTYLNNDSLTHGALETCTVGSYTDESKYPNIAFSDYEAWKNDKVWIPSITETGYKIDNEGLWRTTITERKSYDGTTSKSNWLRSGRDKLTNNNNVLTGTGSGSAANSNVDKLLAVRPAIHLNLTKVEQYAVDDIAIDNAGGVGGLTQLSNIRLWDSLPTIAKVDLPSKHLCAFCGYYTGANGTGTQIYNAMGETSQIYDMSYFTLYAKWMNVLIINVSGASTSLAAEDAYITATSVDFTAIPESGKYVYEFSFDNINWIPVESYLEAFYNYPFALKVEYSVSENSNEFGLSFRWLIPSYTDYNSINLYLHTNTTPYSNLRPANTSKLTGTVAVCATYGGRAVIEGENYDDLDDTDTITCVATACVPGYKFDGWYILDDMTTPLSTEATHSFTKSSIYEKTLIAVFSPIE